MKRYISLLLWFMMSQATSADTVVSIGAGRDILGIHGSSFERVALIGYAKDFRGFVIEPRVGYFFDPTGVSSAWTGLFLGFDAKSSLGPVLSFGVAPSYLVTPDNKQLSGNFQFNLEGCAGIDGMDGQRLSLCYEHLSCAGIKQPNMGRDFLMIQWRWAGL